MSRLIFGFFASVLFASVMFCGVGICEDGFSGIEHYRSARRQATDRQRRLIKNGDGDGAVYSGCEATREGFLNLWAKGFANTHVDTISYCSWCSGLGLQTHNTKVGEIFDRTDGVFSNNISVKLIEQGTDVVEILVEFCHENNMEFFWSMRMNDTHDQEHEALFPQWKKEHPDWLVGSESNRPFHGRWTAADFEHKEVRDLVYNLLEEVCTNYDVDGVELDFFRHPTYFKEVAYGGQATDEQRALMTDLMRRIRGMSERVGMERGRVILVSARTPDSVGYSRALGLEIEKWMAEGLIDMWIPSGYFRLNPWEYSVNLGHKYGVKVYPCLSESRMTKEEGAEVRKSLECQRARAMNVWYSGADGIYTFNYGDRAGKFRNEAGEPEMLERLDKVYMSLVRNPSRMNYWLRKGERFFNRSVMFYHRPLSIKPGENEKAYLTVGEQLSEDEAHGLLPRVTLELCVENLKSGSELKVKLNGSAVGRGELCGKWLEYDVNGEAVNRGVNEFEFLLDEDARERIFVRDLLLWVRYGVDD